MPYAFFVDGIEIIENLTKTVGDDILKKSEKAIEIVYQPQAVFKVRAVTRYDDFVKLHVFFCFFLSIY